MNKLKKSTLTTAVALVLCFTTLVMTGFAATQNLSSYEKFKNSLLNLPSLENATIGGTVKLLDNGVETLSAGVTAKMENQNTMSSKSTMTVNGETLTEEQWSNSEQTVTKSSNYDKYRVYKSFNVQDFMTSFDSNGYTTSSYSPNENSDRVTIPSVDGEGVVAVYSYNSVAIGGEDQTFEDLTTAEQKLIHAAIDLVVGDVKNYFIANGNTITLNLEKNQIPQIAQLVVSVLAEKSSMMRDEYKYNRYLSDFSLDVGTQSYSLIDCFPKLTDDASIQSGNLAVTFDDNNNITSIKGIATVTGIDVDGTAHTLTLDVDLTISDIGTTVADTIDLTGKEVEDTNFFTRAIGEITVSDSNITVTTPDFSSDSSNED